jgi:hypothetical protein
VPVALTKLTPDGSVSTTFTPDASSGPLFVTPSVYVSVPPVWTGSGESVFVMERSARPAATVRVPPLIETDWLSVDGGFVALVLGEDETL